MSNKEMLRRLDEVREVAADSAAYDNCHVQALDQAIVRLDDRPTLALSAAALLVAVLALVRG